MTTTETSERLMDDLKAVMRDAEELMKATSGQTGEIIGDVRNRLTAAMNAAKSTCHRLEEKTVQAAKATDHCIREHPYESLGVAFGVGMLIGFLVARK